ncbi:MAG: hypothetical protein WCA12_09540 [Burkholderiales bacterium]
MEYREQLQPGTGFVHLLRGLQPGEQVPAMPSLAEQLVALQTAMPMTQDEDTPEALALDDTEVEALDDTEVEAIDDSEVEALDA